MLLCQGNYVEGKCINWIIQITVFLSVFIPSFLISVRRVPIKNTFWLRSETDIPPGVLDPKLNEKEPQRHATNNHPNLSELELFCFATLVRKPQAFHHPKMIWRIDRKYKNWTQIVHNCAATFLLQQPKEEPHFNSENSLAMIIASLTSLA